jgi:hypothetical protein
MTKALILASSVGALLGACGGGDDSKDPGTVNPQSARSSIDQVGMVRASMMSSDGPGASSAVQLMTASAQSIVTPMQQASRLVPWVRLLPPVRVDIARAPTGTVMCTPTTCTFESYGDDSTTAGYIVDGSISTSGDTYTFDVTYTIQTTMSTLDWRITGPVTVTDTSVSGSIHSVGDTSGETMMGGYDVSWDVAVDYDEIMLDTTGCPVDGTVQAEASYTVNGMAAYDVAGEVAFGPACGASS